MNDDTSWWGVFGTAALGYLAVAAVIVIIEQPWMLLTPLFAILTCAGILIQGRRP